VVGLLIFVLPTTAFAYNTYIGLKIESVNNPDAPVPTEWCLPAGTSMTITTDGVNALQTCGVGHNEACVVTTTSSTGSIGNCEQDTIWSDLAMLITGESYVINLFQPACPHNAVSRSNYCWVCGTLGLSCTAVCNNLVGTACPNPGTDNRDVTCDDMESACNITCSTCTGAIADNNPTVYNGTECEYLTDWEGWYPDGSSATGNRMCAISVPVEELFYGFSFQAPAE